MKRPLRIGLTGGIGSGKTSVSNIFSEYGVPVIDADTISHEVVQPGQPAILAIAEVFGADVVDGEGQLRRAYLRDLIFDDHAARNKLEMIIHPLVHDGIRERVSLVTFPYCIISSPLLLESRTAHDVDRILVVDVPESLQIERASRRDNSQKCDIQKIIDSQINRKERLKVADDIIINNSNFSYLREQVQLLHKKYLKIASARPVECT